MLVSPHLQSYVVRVMVILEIVALQLSIAFRIFPKRNMVAS